MGILRKLFKQLIININSSFIMSGNSFIIMYILLIILNFEQFLSFDNNF